MKRDPTGSRGEDKARIDGVSGTCKHNAGKERATNGGGTRSEPCGAIQSADKIDGFLITEKNRRNDRCNVAPQVVTIRDVVFRCSTRAIFSAHVSRLLVSGHLLLVVVVAALAYFDSFSRFRSTIWWSCSRRNDSRNVVP